MNQQPFKSTAQRAEFTTVEGIKLLVEINELLVTVAGLPLGELSQVMIEEIIRKEKVAVELIQESMTLQKALLEQQHKAIANLAARLDDK